MALDPTFEIAAAHSITLRTLATWSSRVPRTPRVMVPVQLDALVVRNEGAKWADCAMSTPPAGDGRVPRLSLLPPPFKELAASRPKGVYLHWALPDGLTRATTPDPSTPAQ